MIKLVGILFLISLSLLGCQKSSQDIANFNVEKGNEALSIKDYSRASQFFNRSLDLEPTHSKARLGLTQVWLNLALDSESRNAKFLDSAYIQVGLWKRTLELSDKSFADDKQNVLFYNQIHLNYARYLFFDGLYSKSLGVLNQAIKVDTDSAQYLEYLQLSSFVHFSKSEDSIALEMGRKLIDLYPEFEPAYLDVGKMYWQIEDYEEALVVWSIGQEKFPENEELSYWTLEAMDKTGWLDD